MGVLKDAEVVVPQADTDMERGLTVADMERGLTAGTQADASWFAQFRILLLKNWRVQYRQQIQLFIVVFAPLISVCITYAAQVAYGGDNSPEQIGPLDSCGMPAPLAYASPTYLLFTDGDWNRFPFPPNTDGLAHEPEVQSLHSDLWTSGLGVLLLSIGPFAFAVVVLLNVSKEATTKLLGTLRNLGMSESAYWLSWFVFYAGFAFVNSLLGAGIGKALPMHAFQASSFVAIWLSFFFCELALVACAFLVAAIAGRHARAVGGLGFIMFAVMTTVIMFTGFYFPSEPIYSRIGPASGTSWVYASTEQCDRYNTIYRNKSTGNICQGYNRTFPDVDRDLNCVVGGVNCTLSVQQPIVYSSFDQAHDLTQVFTGCTIMPSGLDSYVGSGKGVILALFPWFHFARLWTIMISSTQLPGKTFDTAMISWDISQVALEALPSAAPRPAVGSLFPQFSMVNVDLSLFGGDNAPAAGLVPNISTDWHSFPYLQGAPLELPSFGLTLLYLFLLMVAYALLAVWVATVFPMGSAVGLKPWYFLMPRYWFPSRTDVQGDAHMKSASRSSIVQTQGLSKTFGEFEAVKDVSVGLEMDKVFTVLGHNGAGKSTLINMLIGQLEPTAGTANIFGHLISKSMGEIRKFIGVCPQHDILYENLTAREHLELFGTLRGVKSDELQDMVQEWLEDVNLDEQAQSRTCTFSGGMKRRLSVALSTVGNTRFIVLDEPTTGMDPCNRTFVWRHIEKVRKGRVILLTTHAMEEADLLSDSVIIMHKGEVAAQGTPLNLKRKYGTPLQFNMLIACDRIPEAKAEIKERLLAAIPTKLEIGSSGNCVLQILSMDNSNIESLSAFLKWVQDPASPVEEYGISNSSLEEVFRIVTGTTGADKAAKSEPDIEVCCNSCCSCCIKGCMCCCCPKTVDFEDGEFHSDQETLDALSTVQPRLAVKPQVLALLRLKAIRQLTGCGSVGLYIWLIFLVILALFLPLLISSDAIVANIATSVCMWMTLPIFVAPLCEETAVGQWTMLRIRGLLGTAYVITQVVYCFCVQFVFSFFVLLVTMLDVTNGGVLQRLGIAFASALMMPGLVLTFAPLFRSHRAASGILGVLTFILVITIVALLEVGQFPNDVSICSEPRDILVDEHVYCVPSAFALLPFIGSAMTLSMNIDSSLEAHGQTVENVYSQKRFTTFLAFSLLGAVLWLLVGILVTYLYKFTPPSVTRLSKRIKGLITCKYLRSSRPEQGVESTGAPGDNGVLTEFEAVKSLLAPFVQYEEAGVPVIDNQATIDHAALPPIAVQNLSKTYPKLGGNPAKNALKDLTIHVEKGQCLALLGPNGAGKTTALKIIAGQHAKTSGVCMVGGYEIAQDKLRAFEQLGNCPQFDVFYDDLSVKDHLVMMAQFKGLSFKQAKDIAHKMATVVGLGGAAYTRHASKLSGGMRRRLSIAMTFLCTPRVVLLDEPTTGLDPLTRGKIWDLIKLFNTPDRGMVITTHSMIEADTLCNRIGIMARGNLQVVGSQEHLKRTYGNGYTVVCNVDDPERALGYLVKNLDPNANILCHQGKIITVQLPDSNLNLEHAFQVLYSEQCREVMNEWLLNQSSLEDVFIKISQSQL